LAATNSPAAPSAPPIQSAPSPSAACAAPEATSEPLTNSLRCAPSCQRTTWVQPVVATVAPVRVDVPVAIQRLAASSAMPYGAAEPRALATIARALLGSAARFTQAERVKLSVAAKRRSAASATTTRSSTPSNCSASPSVPVTPAGRPFAPASAPSWLPTESIATFGSFRSKRQCARRPLSLSGVVADASFDGADVPIVLTARTR
jgi:hypothetical protein